MFGFSPKSSVSVKAGAWIERSMSRFDEIFGADTLRQVQVVLPTPDFFPDDWDGSAAGVTPFLERVCGYMRVNPARLVLDCVPEQEEADLGDKLKDLLPHWEGSRAGAAGTYSALAEQERFKITVHLSRRPDLVKLIATLAHKLGHVHLLGDGHVERDAPEMEPLTDLVTVYCGLGIFNANTAMKFSQYDGRKHGWSVQHLGHLPEPMFGYALACFAWRRGENHASWAKHLNLNVGTYFKQSLKFIQREKGRAG